MPESFSVASLLIPGLVILFVLALVLIIRVMVSRDQKIPPNKVAIIYGRGTSVTGGGQLQGCKVVSGGGVLVWPVFQDIAFMDTAVFNMPIHETDIPNRDNVKITVGGFAACKISTAPEDLQFRGHVVSWPNRRAGPRDDQEPADRTFAVHHRQIEHRRVSSGTATPSTRWWSARRPRSSRRWASRWFRW